MKKIRDLLSIGIIICSLCIFIGLALSVHFLAKGVNTEILTIFILYFCLSFTALMAVFVYTIKRVVDIETTNKTL